VKVRLTCLGIGMGVGFVLSWTQMTDPDVIWRMLLLEEPHVFLIMGSAVASAAIGVRLLRASGMRAITGEPVAWSVEQPQPRHVAGSALFGAGWAVAGTCPGPLAAMIGQGKIAALSVAIGVLGGVVLQRVVRSRRGARRPASESAAAACI
jgi:uncharacterized membrane protein YedE/YeeE